MHYICMCYVLNFCILNCDIEVYGVLLRSKLHGALTTSLQMSNFCRICLSSLMFTLLSKYSVCNTWSHHRNSS
uniref:Uncharacterized protein n=1 Tax=Rhizophora mucronata TaxID=61149 RepID=A0A2P2QY97_RHIMU